MTTKIFPIVTLVGAGPGDPDLITLKGLKAIKNAKVILYDALINRKLLDYAAADAQLMVLKQKLFRVFHQL